MKEKDNTLEKLEENDIEEEKDDETIKENEPIEKSKDKVNVKEKNKLNDNDINSNIINDNEGIDDKNDSYIASDVNPLPELFENSEKLLNEKFDIFLKKYEDRFSSVNPLRIRKSIYKKEKKKEKRKSKRLAIKELVTNLKAQYILFNIRDFIREYHIKESPYINTETYKNIRYLRNFCLLIYGIIILFERPWFCYKGTTIPLPSSFKFIEECDKKVAFMNIPFINNDYKCVIEILITLIIIITQLIKYKDEYILKKTNTGVNKYYNIIQIILFISLFLCLVDLIFSLCIGKFPVLNFVLRPFIYIYLIRRLRLNWISILKVLWETKKAYLALFINMVTFSIIGYNLFKKDFGFFESFTETFLQLYILLSTCNFPDIMIEAMEFSKFAIAYFVIYISINYFILLSFLKTLYTTKYYEVNKNDCLNIIKEIIENKFNKHIYDGNEFNEFIYKQKNIYLLNDEEYNNFLILFNIFDKYTNTFTELIKLVETTPESEMVAKTKYGRFILKSKKVEIIVNLLCIISTATLFSKNIFFVFFHLFVSCLLLYEPIILINYLGIKRVFGHHFNRIIFHIFNIVVLFSSFYLLILELENKEQRFNKIFKFLRIFISLRTIRLFVFLDKFRIIKNIYIIIRVSKEMMYRNLLILYSFILIFSTLSILLTGGNMKKYSFDDENDQIPDGYEYINFNDFASSYIACFCLLMINNLNILVKSLTFQSRHKMFFQFYFATFYFFSTLIIINIIQTLLLEMYLISDNYFSDNQIKIKEENKENKEKNENKKENLINESEE